jgi:hypothetical protein
MTILITALCLVVVLGLAVVVLDHSSWGTEVYTISTRDLPNLVADLSTGARP